MKTHREQILDLIRARPNIRDDAIADALECELDEVYPAIRADMMSTQVLAESVDAVHRIYRINPAYLGWAPPAANSAPGVPVQKADDGSAKTKPEKAIDFIRAHGVATEDDLRTVMGLPPDVYPSSYMKMALQRGDVVHEGKEWRLGTGTPRRSLSQPAAPDKPAAAPAAKPSAALQVPKFTAPKPPRQLPQSGVSSSLAIGDLKIIHWDSGNLVISANDNTIDLTPGQAKALRAFVELT